MTKSMRHLAGVALTTLSVLLLTSGVANAATIATTASPDIVLGAGTLSDTAVVSGVVFPITGAMKGQSTVTFNLFGPNDATCTGAPIFTETVGFFGPPVTSSAFTPTQAGTYRWIASYSGDAFNAPVSGLCNDPNETTIVSGGTPTIATTASPNIVLGAGTLSDTATVSGRLSPVAGATITFTLFGPNDATCAGAPAFTSTVPHPVADGPVTSAAFTPAVAGTYRWIASYSGDANNAPVSGACNDANETTNVAAPPTVSVSNTATPASLPAPGGTFTFSIVVTNTSAVPTTITSLTDSIYGNLAIQGTCTTAVGTVLGPGGTYSCSFDGVFNGAPGATQTNIVTATVIDAGAASGTGAGGATVSIVAGGAVAVPTLDSSMLLLLVVVLAAAGVWALRRRSTPQPR